MQGMSDEHDIDGHRDGWAQNIQQLHRGRTLRQCKAVELGVVRNAIERCILIDCEPAATHVAHD
jgi:hypothetical protein